MSEESTSSSETSSEATQATDTTSVDTQAETAAPQVQPEAEVAPVVDPASEAEAEESTPVPHGETVDNLVAAFLENEGNLSEEQMEALKKTGISEELFVTLANAQQAQIEANDQKVYESVGGQETYQSMISFAQENLSEAQLEAYDAALFSGNPDIANFAVMGLKAMMDASSSEPRNRIDGVTGDNSSGNSAFNSQEQVINAMRDNRYGRDDEYTASVDARRAKSQW